MPLHYAETAASGDHWKLETWDIRLIQMKERGELTAEETADAYSLILDLPPDRQEKAVPKDREVALLVLRKRLGRCVFSVTEAWQVHTYFVACT